MWTVYVQADLFFVLLSDSFQLVAEQFNLQQSLCEAIVCRGVGQ